MKGQKALFSSASEEWSTPQDLFDRLHACFKFSVDLAASDDNHKVACYYTKENSALNQDWNGYTGFCNPPYGKAIYDFVEKAHFSQGIFVFLLPARTDTLWFQSFIAKNPRAKVDFIKGRLKFGGAKNSAPFPSMLVTFLNY